MRKLIRMNNSPGGFLKYSSNLPSMANVEHAALACDQDLYTEDGLYGNKTLQDQTVVEHAWPIIKQLLGFIPFTPGRGPFVICDYGTADGVSSISLMTNCIDWVQKTYGEDQQVHVIYEDRPTNDFNSLIRYVEGVITGSRSYVKDHKNVFVTCCGRSFYKQCLPDASVHLGFSSLAVVWPSASLNVTSQEVFSEHFAAGSPERREFETRAVSDWEMFLLHRAKELVSGGRLVIETIDRTFCPCNKTTGEWCVLRAMTDIWREMVQEHIISEEEFLATTASSYRHSAGILSAPFHDKTSRVTKSGLQLVALETKRIKCIWRERWLMATKHDDSATARLHAVSFVRCMRAWTNRMFTIGLSSQRNVEERKKILDELYSRLVDEVEKAPADRGYIRVDIFVTVAKTREA